MVLERNPEFVAGSDGFCFLAEEPLHSGELLGLCIGQRAQQLRFFRLPCKSQILDLRAGTVGSGDSGSHQNAGDWKTLSRKLGSLLRAQKRNGALRRKVSSAGG